MCRITLVITALQEDPEAGSGGSLLLGALLATVGDGGRAVTMHPLELVTWEGTEVPVDGSMSSGL